MEFPNNCCDFIRNQRLFALPSTISEEDLFSNLPDDCLLSVFKYLNHDDLDVMSYASQKMCNFTNHARPRTVKRPTLHLIVEQKFNRDIVVRLMGIDENFHYMLLKSDHTKREDAQFGTHTGDVPNELMNDYSVKCEKRRRMPCFVYDRIRYLTDRFSIRSVVLCSMQLSRFSLEHWAVSTPFPSVNRIAFNHLHYEAGDDINQYERLMDWIASKRPECLELNGIGLKEYAPELFNLTSTAHQLFMDNILFNGTCRNIHLHNYEKEVLCYPMPEAIHEKIGQFYDFDIDFFVIDVNRLVQVVLDRLELKAKGSISLGTTEKVDRNFLVSALAHRQIEELPPNGKNIYMFKPVNLNWTATFQTLGLEAQYAMQSIILLALAASAVALHPACGVSSVKPDLISGMGIQTSGAITNCIKSVEHAWPWTAGVCQNDWFGTCNFQCVATVIGERWALTTASCINGDLKDWHVRAGMFHENKKESSEQRLAIKAVYQHPSYSPSTKLDNILLIETKDEFKFNEYVQPICLPEDDEGMLSDTLRGWVTGWGSQKQGGDLNKSLEQALIDMDSAEVCERTWSRKIYDSEVCAGEGDKTLCQYDQGVPLMVQSPNGTWFQHGSAAMIDGECRLPAIFSKISYFCSWIFTTTNEDVHCIKRM